MSHYNETSSRISIALNKIKKIATIATLSCVALFNVNAEANTVEKRAARTEEIAALLPSEPSFGGARIEDRAAWERIMKMPNADEVIKYAEKVSGEVIPWLLSQIGR